MYRLLGPEEKTKAGDELLPTAVHYKFVPVMVEGVACGKCAIRRELEDDRYEKALDVYREFEGADPNCLLIFSDWLHARLETSKK